MVREVFSRSNETSSYSRQLYTIKREKGEQENEDLVIESLPAVASDSFLDRLFLSNMKSIGFRSTVEMNDLYHTNKWDNQDSTGWKQPSHCYYSKSLQNSYTNLSSLEMHDLSCSSVYCY